MSKSCGVAPANLSTPPLQMPSGQPRHLLPYWGAAAPRQPLLSRDMAAAAACILEQVVEALIKKLHHKTVPFALVLAWLLPADPNARGRVSLICTKVTLVPLGQTILPEDRHTR